MAEVVDALHALRSANHLHNRLTSQGVSDEDIVRLREIREFLRGLAVLDRLDSAHRSDRTI